MAFVLSGPWNDEAIDEESGIRIQYLGMRGPEIENSHWRAVGNGIDFELSTHVGRDGDDVDGKRRVLLSPSLELIDYLVDGPGDTAVRKATIDKVIDGVALLFSSRAYLAPFFFEKGAAVKFVSVGGQGRLRAVEAPGLWDATRPKKPSSAAAEAATAFVVMSSGEKVKLPVTIEPPA